MHIMRFVLPILLIGMFIACPALALDDDAVRGMPVGEEDVRILVLAEELLKEESLWNRQDDRRCVDDEQSGRRSLFCALHRASVDVLGGYNHRRAALQHVRLVIKDLTPDSGYQHRLLDYNNDPKTTFADIRKVLDSALGRVRLKLTQGEVP
jgi:hypothetical protein